MVVGQNSRSIATAYTLLVFGQLFTRLDTTITAFLSFKSFLRRIVWNGKNLNGWVCTMDLGTNTDCFSRYVLVFLFIEMIAAQFFFQLAIFLAVCPARKVFRQDTSFCLLMEIRQLNYLTWFSSRSSWGSAPGTIMYWWYSEVV